MIYILANDSRLARIWAEDQGLANNEWRAATVEALRALPSGDRGGHRLVVLEGGERSPDYSMVFDMARDRGIETVSAAIEPGEKAL